MQNKNLNNKESIEFVNNLKRFNEYQIAIGDSKEVIKNISNFFNIHSFERPDMYIELDDVIIAIEHFEFSAYSTNRNGNKIKKKLFEIEQENLKNRDLTKEENYFEHYVLTDISRNNYEKNFIDAFKMHYKKIEEYKKNLAHKNKEILMYFLICDETIEGTGIVINGKYEFYTPVMNKKILELLLEHSKVDGLIFQCNCVFNQKVFYYLKNTKENINKLLEENIKYFGIELERENFTNISSYYGEVSDE